MMMPNNMNPVQMMQKFMEFQKSFTGNPQQEVMKLVSSGRISQEQLNQLQGMAQQFQSMMNTYRR